MVDDNVVLTFSHPGRENIIIKKDGFKIRGDGSTGTGKSNDVIYFREGSYKLKAELEQIPGKPLAKGNPMALAIHIKTAFVLEDVEIISPKSWNENPMGVAMVIDAPMPLFLKRYPNSRKEDVLIILFGPLDSLMVTKLVSSESGFLGEIYESLCCFSYSSIRITRNRWFGSFL